MRDNGPPSFIVLISKLLFSDEAVERVEICCQVEMSFARIKRNAALIVSSVL
jgi:hypothetical protein